MKRLYVSDLDGTLLNEDKKITPYTAEVINEFIEKGGLFSIATARTAGTVVDMLKEINISCPVILMNGAMVYDIKKEEYIKYEVIEDKAFLKITEIVKDLDINGFLYVYDGNKVIACYEKLGDVVKDFYDQRKNSDKYKKFVKTDCFKSLKGQKYVYFALMDTYEKLYKANELLCSINIAKAFYKDIYDESLYYLEIFSENATKANGVKFLKNYLNADKVTAFGDNLNDLDMFEIADFKVAPENAVNEVKKAADFICESNSCDGVSKYISKEGDFKNE